MFSFLQIRPDQTYDYLVLVTFWFDGFIDFYKINKQSCLDMIQKRIFKKQHGGMKSNSGTYCYSGTMNPFLDYFWFRAKVNG